MLPEGVLNRGQGRAKRGVSGEAPQALPVEGVLNPINSVLSPNNCISIFHIISFPLLKKNW